MAPERPVAWLATLAAPLRLIPKAARRLSRNTLIIATGASARWLNLPNEQKLTGRGVSSCATCVGFFFRNNKIMVVGARRYIPRASKIIVDRALANPKITILGNTVVDDVYDVEKGEVTGVKLRNLKTLETYDRDVDGFFVAIGHIPNTKAFASQLDLDAEGYIITHGGARTNIAGVFHAGDVQDRTYRQAITASGAGCMAAIEVERFLEAEGH